VTATKATYPLVFVVQQLAVLDLKVALLPLLPARNTNSHPMVSARVGVHGEEGEEIADLTWPEERRKR
jgi:hypothetical protein